MKHTQVISRIRKGYCDGQWKTYGGTSIKASVAEYGLVVCMDSRWVLPCGSPWTWFSSLECFDLADCFHLYEIPHLYFVFIRIINNPL